MRVLNIIEHDSSTRVGLISIKSFGIPSEDREEEVEQAQEHFIELIVNSGESSEEEEFLRDQAQASLEEGVWESGTYSVYFAWSRIENIQI